MPRTVFASFQTEAEAERALASVASQADLLDSAVVGSGPSGSLTLDSMNLGSQERSACETQLKRGGFLLVAQAAADADADRVLSVLHGAAGDGAPLIIAEASAAPASSPATAAEETVQEERIPIVEEELRIGKREVVRGGARVHSSISEVPVSEQVELTDEQTSVERRPVNRRLTEEEVTRAGLLQDRVIEIAMMREEAVVSKEAFVREELVVTKHVEQRVEEIHDTLRRTEVETERLEPRQQLPENAAEDANTSR